MFNKKKKIENWFEKTAMAPCHVFARANTVGELKEMFSKLGNDDAKVIFFQNKEFIEIKLLEKGAINITAGQLPSENPKPLEFKECIFIKF